MVDPPSGSVSNLLGLAALPDDHYVGERHPKVDHPPNPLRAPHELLVGALCHELVRSTTHRFVAQNGAGLPFPEISHLSPSSARRSRVRRES
jgi:hypothetical protein